MVETAVVMALLTQEMIQQGAELARALEQEGVTILTAFWLPNIETGRWRLFIGTPDVDRIGWLELYGIARPLWNKFGDTQPSILMRSAFCLRLILSSRLYQDC
jgi:hypothetical protein